MGLLRPEEMGYYALITHSDVAWKLLTELGKLSALQFIDLNNKRSIVNRTFSAYIRRSEEALRRISFIIQEIHRFKIPLLDPAIPEMLLEDIDLELEIFKMPEQAFFERVEEELALIENQILTQLRSYEQLLRMANSLIEKKTVLEKAKEIFGFQGVEENLSLFAKFAGVINKNESEMLKRMAFRVTRGNCLTFIYDLKDEILDPKTDEKLDQAIFFIVFMGNEEGAVANSLRRICDAMSSLRIEIPGNPNEMDDLLNYLHLEIINNKSIAEKTKENLRDLLQRFCKPKLDNGAYSMIYEYQSFILKEKEIFKTLNMFDTSNTLWQGNCWCPKSKIDYIRVIINEYGEGRADLKEVFEIPRYLTPPSFFKLNDFTAPIQGLIDTYGIPSYREINPTPITCITFPFLFGIMLGDIGHGLILTLIGAYLCLKHSKLKISNGILSAAAPYRYLILTMGVFSMYSGFIYNEFFGIPLNLFGSKWQKNSSGEYEQDSAYPFGLDPIWSKADNELSFLNSFKMKISIIFGVLHMTIGIMYKGLNSIAFKKRIDFYYEVMPQFIFMLSLFGYLVCMIFIKWNQDWNYNYDDNAPSLINTFLGIFLDFGGLHGQKPLWGNRESQESLQACLFLIALLCLPIMLLPKPLYLRYIRSKRIHYEEINQIEDFDFFEEFTKQLIFTIETTVGVVSNSASYLRLWALSLAHFELSKTFLTMCVFDPIKVGDPFLVAIGFFAFVLATFIVLLMMASIECFLHTLRLHWVEFQNKFYAGEGIKFVPFSFCNLN
ncbi:unnamed protein product [Blepharisma stoltei]|uniref:V-type proton ATPase subunit a n=1 Tax=Blepharisma stoltei TaxID=1481888 RepID=A0AAU9K157_9CILI|nr:unnamed protein product [Blepharisma stoltei]